MPETRPDDERAQYERVEARARKFAMFENTVADGDAPGRPTLRALIGEIDRIRELLAMLQVLERDRSKDLLLAQQEYARSQKARNRLHEVERAATELDNARFAYEATESAAAHLHHRRMQTALSKVLARLPVPSAIPDATEELRCALNGERDDVWAGVMAAKAQALLDALDGKELT